ncbi:MAG: M20 family metallopeptidase [Thermoplasmata archaeon]
MTRPVGPWVRKARRVLPAMRAWRADLHREPELSNEEHRTQQKILEALGGLGITTRTYNDFNGVLGVIAADRPGPVVALRADMDALPVTEETNFPFRSRTPGKMHACGHDVHMTCLLGAAAILHREENRLVGPVKLLFQPAEEEGVRGGALPFIERGCLEDPHADFVVGQHVDPGVALGSIGWKTGPIMAAADHFVIRIRGTPGHAAHPHRGPDAVVVAAEIVTGLQALVSRMRNPLDPVVVSVGMIHGGTRHNILPEEVVLEGTVRTFRADTRSMMEKNLRRRVALLARSMGASTTTRYIRGYPVTVNEPKATQIVAEALRRELGKEYVTEMERPEMGAEDFSRYLEKVPGTFLRLGVGEPGHPMALHSPTFAPNEAVLITGAAALASAVEGLQAP